MSIAWTRPLQGNLGRVAPAAPGKERSCPVLVACSAAQSAQVRRICWGFCFAKEWQAEGDRPGFQPQLYTTWPGTSHLPSWGLHWKPSQFSDCNLQPLLGTATKRLGFKPAVGSAGYCIVAWHLLGHIVQCLPTPPHAHLKTTLSG